jgi:glycerol-3-phosphate dehydrogenase
MWRGNWREEYWAKLSELWDIIIVGGGIVGAGILRESARLGLRALLVEQRDFGWGSSSRSSKFVHGGLRYLKEYQFRMTWEAVHERQHLLKGGYGLIEPIGFLITRYEGDRPGALTVKAALTVYDLMGRQRNRRTYTKEQLLMLVPRLREANLVQGFGYRDAQTDDARLTLRVISEAQAAGGVAINYVKGETLLRENAQVTGIVLHDEIEDHIINAPARVVVNATGAWADRLLGQMNLSHMIRPVRGSHLIFASWRLPVAQAVNINHPVDGRPITIAPWEGVTIVGCTDLDHKESLDSEASITPTEVAYLMGAVEKGFPSLQITLEDVVASYAGVRPIVDTGEADPSNMPRDPKMAYNDGLLTVGGGKLTTFRTMALDALRIIPKEVLNIDVPHDTSGLDPITTEINLPETKRKRLLGRYGNAAGRVVKGIESRELETIPGTNILWVELKWAAQAEAVIHLDDLLLRRVRLGILVPEGAKALLPQIRAVCQPELGWDDARWEAEESRYLAVWKQHYSLPPHDQIPDWRLPTNK